MLEGARRQGYPADAAAGELVGMLIYALANGLALEKLTNPDAVPDELFADMLALIFRGLEALAREGSLGEVNAHHEPRANAAEHQKPPTAGKRGTKR